MNAKGEAIAVEAIGGHRAEANVGVVNHGYDRAMQSPAWQSQGNHRYYRDVDLLFVEVHGIMDLADIRLIYEVCDVIEREHGYMMALFDSSDAGALSPTARRFIGERNRLHTPPGALAIVGASFGLRAMVLLLNNASRLFGKVVPIIQFCATLDEAMPWLDGQRRQLRMLHRPG